jgi:UDP-N-acetylmuramoyl-tripeptide--D-alanyl-D-alanine ligase
VLKIRLTAATVAAAAGGQLIAGDPAQVIDGFSIDTRSLAAGDLFLAIRGEHFDGHRFVAAAFERGAVGVVVEDGSALTGMPERAIAIVVKETVGALQSLARYVRRESRAKVTAITGSAGKTTTKEAAAAFLERRFSVFRNRGNLNNHIGLPLSLLELRHGPDMAVVELGMNHAGEISTLVGIAEPEVRVWTNVAPAHLEFFGSVDAIADAKAEIFEGAHTHDVLIANADDPLVMARVGQFAGRVVTFGLASDADVRASNVRDRGLDGIEAELETPAGSVPLNCPLIGEGNLANVLAAAAVALHFKVPLSDISTTAGMLRPMQHRGEVRRLQRGLTVIDDSYNSNPSALTRAVQVVGGVHGRRRLAVIGEMLELGPSSTALHEQCGRALAASGFDSLVTVGGEPARVLGQAAAAAGMPAASVVHAGTSTEAADVISRLVAPGDVVLVKGSRGIRTETVVERLVADWG